MDLLLSIVRDTPNVITSPMVFNDIRNLRYNNGKIEASEKTHDDSIMSYLITRWAIAYTPWFRNKKFIGGALTQNLLLEGSKIYSGLELDISGFNGILSLDTPMGQVRRVNNVSKTINSTNYAEDTEKREQDLNKNKNRARFSGFLKERY